MCNFEDEDELKTAREAVLDRNSQNENACRAQEEAHDMMPFFLIARRLKRDNRQSEKT